ncbi:MAG: hypothetical protein R6U04_00535 [Bacteroidales bacterium]
MRVVCKQFLLILLFLFITNTILYTQNPSYQLTIESGGYVDFKIVSMHQYENDGGIDYPSWTRLKVVYNDTTDGTQEWKLGFKAGTSDFITGVENRTLPLNYVSVYVADIDTISNDDNVSIEDQPLALTDEYQELVENADEGTYRLYVTYQLDSVLLENYPDYYNTEIIYKIVPNGENF